MELRLTRPNILILVCFINCPTRMTGTHLRELVGRMMMSCRLTRNPFSWQIICFKTPLKVGCINWLLDREVPWDILHCKTVSREKFHTSWDNKPENSSSAECCSDESQTNLIDVTRVEEKPLFVCGKIQIFLVRTILIVRKNSNRKF